MRAGSLAWAYANLQEQGEEEIMRHPTLTGRQFLRHWWFALLLAVILVGTAMAATPQGSSLIDSAVSAAGIYYTYFAAIFR